MSDIQPVNQPVRQWPVAMMTGHRPQSLTPTQAAWAQETINRITHRLVAERGTRIAISGMALGADTWWAQAALQAGMELHAYIPFLCQSARWSEPDRETWCELRNRATFERVIGGSGYRVQDLFARNAAMLDSTERSRGLVVAVHKNSVTKGGTVHTLNTALRRGLTVLKLDPDEETVKLHTPT